MDIKIDLEDVKETVTNLMQAGVAQTKRVATSARLRADNMAQKDAIRKAYQQIGKKYYAKMKETPEEGFEDLFAKVNEAFEAIAANEALLAVMKSEKDAVVDVDFEDVPEDEDEETFAAEEEEAPAEEETPAEEEAPAEEEPPVQEDAPTEE